MSTDLKNPFVSRYQTYKKLTEDFATGLHSLAIQSGYKPYETDTTSNSSNLSTRGNPAPSSTRLKGKARKLAKSHQQKPSTKTIPDSTTHQAKPSVILKTTEFVKIANLIVESAKVKVPAGFLSMLRKTIRLRKAFSKRFAHLFQSTTSKAVDGHQHFVSVLEEVYKTLLGSQKQATDDKIEHRMACTSVEETTNMFASLALHGSEEDETLAEAEEQELNLILAAKTHTAIIEIDDDQDETEALFALFCMAEDLHEIRNYLRSLWHTYASNSLALTTAAVVTNTAIDFSNQVVGEFLTRFPRFKSYTQIQNFMIDKAAKFSGKTSSQILPDRVSDFLFLNSLRTFEKLLPVIQKHSIPVYNGAFGEYTPGLRPSSRMEKEINDMLLILEIFPHFCALTYADRPLPGLDELSKTFIDFYRTKEITVALVFGSQILLDIHYALDDFAQESLGECKTTGQQSLDLIRYIQSTPSMFSNSQNLAVLKQLESFVQECILGDIVGSTVQRVVPRQYVIQSVASTTTPQYLLKNHPLLCGTMMFSLQLQNHEMVETFVMATGSVIQSTHLINLLQQNKYTLMRWPLLDEYVQIYSPECLFAGPVPVSPEDCLKRLYLILGGHVSTFASNPRGLSQPRRAGKDWTKRRSTLIDTFFMRYVEGKPLAWTKESVDKLIEETFGAPVEIEVEDSKFSYSPYGLSIMQTLHSIHFLLDHDKTLHFDLFKLQRACSELLVLLHRRLENKLLKYTEGARYAEDPTQIPFVANAILMVAAGSSQSAKHLKLDRKSVVRSELLMEVAEIFDEYTRSKRLSQ